MTFHASARLYLIKGTVSIVKCNNATVAMATVAKAIFELRVHVSSDSNSVSKVKCTSTVFERKSKRKL